LGFLRQPNLPDYRRVEGISGATIASDGSVALIVDIGGIVRLAGRRKAA
jgi:two-component system chemotaxis sensor kinase CheA